jgi:predicted transcriptional regulator
MSHMDAGRVLREARRRAGLSQREVAKRADVPQSSIAKIESGVVTPRVDTLDRLLAACGEALEAVRRKGEGVDRSVIRNLIRISHSERAAIAVAEARNVDRLLAKAKRR